MKLSAAPTFHHSVIKKIEKRIVMRALRRERLVEVLSVENTSLSQKFSFQSLNP